MSKSQRLRLHDVRAVYRLLGECRELSMDAEAWRRHLLTVLCHLVHAQVGLGGESRHVGPERLLVPVTLLDHGWEPAARSLFFEYQRRQVGQRQLTMQRFARLPGRLADALREQMVSDREWYGSEEFNEFHRGAGLDDCLASKYELTSQDLVDNVYFMRRLKERRFGEWDHRLLRLFHRELGPLIGTALVGSWEPNLAGLSPRRRQTLEALLEGDSEKQIAQRLGLSGDTIHDYVKGLHRHFGVSSRGELLALFIRRFRARPAPNPDGRGTRE